MIYDELAKFDSTPTQDLGLQIQFKQDTDAQARGILTPGAYLAVIIGAILDDYASRHVVTILTDRRIDAYAKADDRTRAEADALLGVDAVIDVTTATASADEGVRP